MARSAFNDPEMTRLTRRYLTPEHGGVARYALLTGHFRRLGPTERAEFGRALAEDAARITPAELAILLDGGWRARRTAAWYIAVARRTEFRDQLSSLLLASEMPFASTGYCVALTCFGAPADADLLVTYLDRYLLRPDFHYDQGRVLGALLCCDTTLETDHASQFLVPDGLWQQWLDAPHTQRYTNATPQQNQAFIGQLCAFADESANAGPIEKEFNGET